jgi:ATP-dependent DNA ligase
MTSKNNLSESWKKAFMLCQSIDEETATNLDEQNYQANIKYDGERIMAIVISNDVILVNRRGKICNIHFQEIVDDLKKLPNCIIDGEVISVNDDFQQLQRRALTKTLSKIPQLQKEVPVKYMVFDVLGIGVGDNKINLPLRDRIIELQNLFKDLEFKHTELAEYKSVNELLPIAQEQKREGLVVKNLNGKYDCNKRSDNWKKLKFFNEIDIIVTKYTQNPKGIRVEDDEGNACQIAGEQHKEVKDLIDNEGKAEITIQYLSQNEETKRYRFPSFKKLVVSN